MMQVKKITAFVFGLMTCFGLSAQPLADGQSKFLGCAYSSNQSTNFSKYWNQVTPENGGKWGSAEPRRDAMNWSEMDVAYNLAESKGFAFKEHTLIWGNQQPGWMESLDSASQREEIEEWFSLVAARYPGIDYIDVVNEPLHAPPTGANHGNYIKALGGNGSTGWDWVLTSFRLARQYFPWAKLLINEYSVTNNLSSAQQYKQLISLLQADSLIDGIGIQGHAFSTYGVSPDLTRSCLDLLASTGLPIYISELDIDGTSDLVQLREYMRVFPVFWQHPAVQGITMWGFRYGLWRTNEGAYLVNQAGTERAAFTWLKAYINDTLTLSSSITLSAKDDTDTLYLDETLQYTATVLPLNTTIKTVSFTVSPTSAASISATGLLTPVTTGIVTVRATTWDKGRTTYKNLVILKRPVDSISISIPNGKDTITLAETLQLHAGVWPANAADTLITWKVIQPELATISAEGLLTPVTTGTVTVVARAHDGSGATDTVYITLVDPTVAEKIQAEAISVYPNPVNNGRFILTGIAGAKEILISDLNGRNIAHIESNGDDNRVIETRSDWHGLYVITVSGNHFSVHRKIVIP
ncbi:MAG TPA: endo-1,4-beta-xylanase [Bacteroidales bacterium]|nr:endo-1,4-beta-xylanase [Bacteroidales bacterium]